MVLPRGKTPASAPSKRDVPAYHGLDPRFLRAALPLGASDPALQSAASGAARRKISLREPP